GVGDADVVAALAPFLHALVAVLAAGGRQLRAVLLHARGELRRAGPLAGAELLDVVHARALLDQVGVGGVAGLLLALAHAGGRRFGGVLLHAGLEAGRAHRRVGAELRDLLHHAVVAHVGRLGERGGGEGESGAQRENRSHY